MANLSASSSRPSSLDVSATTGQRADALPRRTRQRKALSCTACKERKIKCDRNVPRCNSCVVRGIEDNCRWGDERDGDVSLARHSSDYRLDRAGERSPLTPTSDEQRPRRKRRHSSLLAGVDEGEVAVIVEAVLKKIGHRRARSATRLRVSSYENENDTDSDSEPNPGGSHDGKNVYKSSSRSQEGAPTPHIGMTYLKAGKPSADIKTLLSYHVAPPPNTVARRMHMTAFEGKAKAVPFSSQGDVDKVAQLDLDTLTPSLRQLPRRSVVEGLIEVYMREVEPIKNLFNRAILTRQLEELWDDIAELDLDRAVQASKEPVESYGRTSYLDAAVFSVLPSKRATAQSKDRTSRLCSVPRQGLVAVVFSLAATGARSAKLSELVQLGLLSNEATQQEVSQFCEQMVTRAEFHISQSDFVIRPTFWILQYAMLNDFSASAMLARRLADNNPFHAYFGATSLALYIATSLGINRLGNAYDDVQQIRRAYRASLSDDDRLKVSPNKVKAPEDSVVTLLEQQNLLSTIRLGSWMAEFEKENLAHRDLGRKLWTMLVSMDCFMSSHLNQSHCVHDGIDQTAPPAPLNDEDLLSPHADILIAQSSPDSAVPKANTFCAYYLATAKTSRLQVQLENEKGAPLPYEDILLIDDHFQAILRALPPYLSLSANGADEQHQANVAWAASAHQSFTGRSDASTEAFALQRAILNDQIHFRTMRIHRLHLGKGFKDKRYRRSAESCLRAAQGLLEARTAMEQADRMIRLAFFMKNHLVHAALVFQLMLLHEMDRSRAMTAESTPRAHGRRDRQRDDDTYIVEDFDSMLANLQLCVDYLRPDNTLSPMSELIFGLETFLNGVKAHRDQQLRAMRTNPPGKNCTRPGPTLRRNVDGTERRFRPTNVAHPSPETQPPELAPRSHADAASILASMPTLSPDRSPVSGSASSATSSLAIDSIHSGSHYTPWPSMQPSSYSLTMEGSDLEALPINAHDPMIWSLEALFPDYAEGIDLISALERQFLSSENGQ